MDVARLGIRVDSGDAVTGKRNLDNLTNSGRRLEGRVNSLVRSVGMLGAAFGAAFSLTSSIAQARQLDAAIGELSTLIPGATRDLVAMTEASQAFGASFGTGTRAQAQAFYAAVSAGATDSAEAIARVDAANRLAIGGAADLTGSIAILNAATNAYADENLTAADASDILFTGVRTGVTTVDELSAGLGRAIPIASALGIGLDELVGGVSALTTQGQSTELAVTGIRAALNATLQPSQQAAELADQLGISFNSAAVESMGFLGFMQHVAERTGGSRDALTTLFGSVEAGTAVLSFAGQGGVKFAEVMDQMADRAGAADEAYDQMAQRLSTRWNVIMATAAERAEDFGLVMLSGIVPAAEEVIQVLTGAEDASLALEIAMKAAAVTAGVLMVQSVGSAAASMIAASAATGIWWTSLQLLTVQGGAAIVMSQALGAAIRFALGPIGLAITAVGLLTMAWVNHRSASERARDEYQDLYDLQDSMQVQARNLTALTLDQADARLVDARATRQQVLEQYRLTTARVDEARALLDAAQAQAEIDRVFVGGGTGVMPGESEAVRAAQTRLQAAEDAAQAAREMLSMSGAEITMIERQIQATRNSTVVVEGETSAIERNTASITENTDEVERGIRKTEGLTDAQNEAKWIYEQIHAPAEQYRTTLLAINQLLDEGQITQSQFTMRMREAQSAMLQASVDSGQASWIDGILAGLDKVAIRSQNVAFAMRDAFGSAAQSISQGFGDAIGRSIVFAEDLGGALMNVARNAVAQLISSFVQLGIQWLVNQAIGQSIATAATAASVGQATTVAAAWAPAAAAVSLASFGANSVPAMAGMAAAFAMSQGMAALGGLPGLNSGGSIMIGGNPGIDKNVMSINGSPVARVGRGERIDVIPRGAANDRGANDRGGVTVNIGTINAGSDVSREEVYAAVREGAEQAVVQSTRISAKDTNAKIERLARPQISARGY